MHATDDASAQGAPVTVRLDGPRLIRRLLATLLLVELAIVVLDAVIAHGDLVDHGAIRRLFNNTREDALPSWFGVTQTFLVVLTLAWLAVVEHARAAPRRIVVGWTVLAAFFLYMAMDDGSMLHERVGTWFKDRQEDAGGALSPSYGWQVIFLPFFGAMGLFLVWFVATELRDRTSRLLVVTCVAMLALAVGMDFVEGLDFDHELNLYRIVGAWPSVDELARRLYDEDGYELLLHFSKSFEEALEMAVNSVLWFVFLRHLIRVAPDQRVVCSGSAA